MKAKTIFVKKMNCSCPELGVQPRTMRYFFSNTDEEKESQAILVTTALPSFQLIDFELNKDEQDRTFFNM